MNSLMKDNIYLVSGDGQLFLFMHWHCSQNHFIWKCKLRFLYNTVC